MKVEMKDLSPVKKSLSIAADPDEIREETETVVGSYAARARIPGFRAGRVPISVIRSRFAREIREDVRQRLCARLYKEATREKGLRPVGEPVLDEVAENGGESFRFTTTVEVEPEFTVRGYDKVEVREPAVTVTEADVDAALEELRKSQVRLVAEDGRAAATGDVVVADVEGTPEEGTPFRRESVLIEVGLPSNLPAFTDALMGATAGSMLEFSVQYPKDYDAQHLSGKSVAYRIQVHAVKRSEYPELDDEFAKDLGEFETLAALRERIRSDLTERGRAQARHLVRQRVLEKVLLENPIPLPEGLVEEEIRRRLEDIARSILLRGADPRSVDLDWKAVREQQVEPARRAVHARLVLDSIAARESIRVTPEEVNERIRHEAEHAGRPPHEIRDVIAKGVGLEAFQNQMIREKSLDFLTSVANIFREG